MLNNGGTRRASKQGHFKLVAACYNSACSELKLFIDQMEDEDVGTNI